MARKAKKASSARGKQKQRVVVPNVKIAKGITQKVTFIWNKVKHRFIARTRGYPPIKIVADDDGKFHARNGAVDVKAPTADKAFAKAARQLWVA